MNLTRVFVFYKTPPNVENEDPPSKSLEKAPNGSIRLEVANQLQISTNTGVARCEVIDDSNSTY